MADIRINALATTATTPASDDYLALDGTAQGTRKILATNIANNVTDVILGTSGPSVKSTLSARAPRQGLVFDGSLGASISPVPSAFGTGDFTISYFVRHNTITTSQEIHYNGGLAGYKANGNYYVDIPGVTGVISATYSNQDKTTLITLTRSGTTATLYFNGISVATATSSSNITTGINVLGSTGNGIIGCIANFTIYNRALSAAEVVALYEAGAPSGADYQTAGQYNSSAFANTVVPYTTFSGASATGFTAAQASGTAYAMSGNDFTVRIGAGATQVRVSGTLTLNSGKTIIPSVLLASNSGTTIGSSASLGAAGAFSVVISASVVASTACRVWFGTTGDANYTISNAKVEVLGLLLAPDAAQAGGGYVWNDQSGNLAQIVLPSSGVQWNLPSVAGQRIRGTTSTNGNEQLLGASVLLPAECQITHVRARARSGTPTITIGTASGGAQIVASVALSTTWLNCTIALTGGIVSSADDIWVGSNSTDVVETDIAFQPLDF